jgi:polysaccharide export outer membrane protein
MRNDVRILTCVLALSIFTALPESLFSQASGSGAQTSKPAASDDAGSPNKGHDPSYIIGANDMLAVNVWKEPEISRVIPVRSDGNISLPLAGEVHASGQTPLQLEQLIAAKLKDYISDPEVTVIVQESKSQKFNILGQVQRPGAYMLTASTTVLDAIAQAGGFRDFAKQKSIYVLRKSASGQPERLPFNYKDVISGKNEQQNITLKAEDTIVVP